MFDVRPWVRCLSIGALLDLVDDVYRFSYHMSLFRDSSRGLPADLLANMRFAVFGLGDSGYIKYNATARKLHARLLQLGAAELVSNALRTAVYNITSMLGGRSRYNPFFTCIRLTCRPEYSRNFFCTDSFIPKR